MKQPILDELYVNLKSEQKNVTNEYFLKKVLPRRKIQNVIMSYVWQTIGDSEKAEELSDIFSKLTKK